MPTEDLRDPGEHLGEILDVLRRLFSNFMLHLWMAALLILAYGIVYAFWAVNKNGLILSFSGEIVGILSVAVRHC